MSVIAASSDRTSFLRRILLVDAATCIAMGLGLSLASGFLAGLLALPTPLLLWSGLLLLPIGAFMAWVATRSTPPRLGVAIVIAGNAAWVGASIALIVGGWVSPNLLGKTFVIAQAAAVVGLDILEYLALRKAWA